jgi:hypothetical protein
MPKYYRSRLGLEKALVSRELPQFHFYKSGDTAYFKGWQSTSKRLKKYQLKLVLPRWYPDEMPFLYVVRPETLYKYGSRGTVNADGISHEFHTLTNGPGGCVQICHFKHDRWDASKTCVGALMKGIVWLEAYEKHLQTGRTIADIIDELKRRQESCQPRMTFFGI